MSKAEEVTAMYESAPNFKNIKSLAEIPDSYKQDLRSANPIDLDKDGNPTNLEEALLWQALEGKSTYHQWINKRKLIENVSKSTVNGWNTKLIKISKWKGSDYLADLTKSEALQFKDYLLSRGHELSLIHI